MVRRTNRKEMLTTTTTADSGTAPTKALYGLRRRLNQHLAARRCARAAVVDAIAEADKALQGEYIRYGHPRAPDPRLAAYHNVQQVLVGARDPQRAPEYAERDESDAAYIAEVERLRMLVEHVLAAHLE